METNRGSAACPWVVKATPGQTVTMTLIDFAARNSTAVQSTATGDTYADVGQICVIYAEIKERAAGAAEVRTASAAVGAEGGGGRTLEQRHLRRVALVCGGERREKVVFTATVTTESELFVNVHATSFVDNPAYFLIKFEGN